MDTAGIDSLPVMAMTVIAVASCALIVMLVISMMHPREPGTTQWSMAYSLLVVSTIVMVLRGPRPDPVMLLAGNACLVLSYAMLWFGYARFLQVPLPWLPATTVVAAFLAGYSWFLYVSPAPGLRSGLLCFVLAALAGGAGYTLLRRMQPALLQSQAAAAFVLGVVGILYLLRGLFVLSGRPDDFNPGGELHGPGLLLVPGISGLLLAAASGVMLIRRQPGRQLSGGRADLLTGGEQLAEIAGREISRARRHGYTLCLLLLDIDHFGDVNRRHGHAAGDDVLRQLAALLSRSLRREDILARLEGGSFCVLLPSTRLAGAEAQAERLRHHIAEAAFTANGAGLRLTASFGLVTLGTHGDDWPALLQRAHGALHQAKTDGRNRIETAPLPSAPPLPGGLSRV